MITTDEKIFLSKNTNAIIVRYAKQFVLSELLNEFSFEEFEGKKTVSGFIREIALCQGMNTNPDKEKQLKNFANDFISNLDEQDLTSLHYWHLNENIVSYINEFEEGEESESMDEFNSKFGRDLAYKLYETNSSGINDELTESLHDLLLTFASEFDFSLIDESTIERIEETIENYTNKSGRFSMV